MHGDWNSGWDWLWMTLMLLVWLVAIGGVVYAAVRYAIVRDRDRRLTS
jgi:hypothetical protein